MNDKLLNSRCVKYCDVTVFVINGRSDQWVSHSHSPVYPAGIPLVVIIIVCTSRFLYYGEIHSMHWTALVSSLTAEQRPAPQAADPERLSQSLRLDTGPASLRPAAPYPTAGLSGTDAGLLRRGWELRALRGQQHPVPSADGPPPQRPEPGRTGPPAAGPEASPPEHTAISPQRPAARQRTEQWPLPPHRSEPSQPGPAGG